MDNLQLLAYFNELFTPERFRDYCPNGLQVEGKTDIQHLVTGVTASEALIDEAIARNADAIFVHHGYFWKGEDPCIRGMKRNRLKKLLAHDVNLYAYHLPLDVHPQYGNNAQLAALLGIEVEGPLQVGDPTSVSMRGRFAQAVSSEELAIKLQKRLGRTPLVESGTDKPIKTVAWCTGGGQGYIELAAQQGIDAFITGEVSEQTIHTAREMKMHFFSAGHHATERYGAKATGEHLMEKFGLQVTFVDIPNPA